MVAGGASRGSRGWTRRCAGRGRHLIVGVVLFGLVGFGAVGQAVGATGDISYDGCISNDGSGGKCADAPGSPLTTPVDVAVSPDGKSVYVVSPSSGTVTHLFAATGGQLSYDGCVSNDGSGGACADAPGTPLQGARGVAVSPNGRSVYVASSVSGTITHFFAAAAGQITYDGCISNDGSGGACAAAPGSPLTSASAVAVSPDGNSVYVIGNDTVAHFFAAAGGQLTYDGCVSNDGSGGSCGAASGAALTAANSVAVSPNGRSVYVSGLNGVAHFFAAPGGQLTYDGCVSDDGSDGKCAAAGGTSLYGTNSVAASPDGKSVYTTSFSGSSSAVSHFFAAAGGQLTYDGCISNDGSGGKCAVAQGDPLQGAHAVAVSPDGKSLYVASVIAGTLSTFTAATASGGQLTYSRCVGSNAHGVACVDGNPLMGISGVAVNSQGTAVYAISSDANDVAHFFRASDSAGGGGGTSGGGGSGTSGGGATTPTLTALTITPHGFVAAPGGPSIILKPSSRAGGKMSFQLNVAATVSFVVQHPLPGRRQVVNGKTRCVAVTHKNAHAGSCVRVVTVGSFTQAGAVGANSLRFSGRVNGRRLPVGNYSIVATPSTAGGTGAPAAITFRIKH